MHHRQSQRLVEKKTPKQLPPQILNTLGRSPFWLPSEIWMMLAEAGLSVSDLKALRCVSRFHRDIATPALFSNAPIEIEFGGDRKTTAVARRIGQDRQFGLMVKSLRFLINSKRNWRSSPPEKSDLNVILTAIQNLDNLRDLHLYSSPVPVIVQAFAGKCRQLKCLKLYRVIYPDLLPSLAGLPCLEELHCCFEGSNPLEHIFPTKVLLLSQDVMRRTLALINQGARRIRFDTLERLRLSIYRGFGSRLSEEQMSIFFPPTNTNMKELSLSYSWLADRTAQWLDSRRTSYPNLVCLRLDNLPKILDDDLCHSIAGFVKHHPFIEDLSLMSHCNLSDVILSLPYLKRLKSLHLGIGSLGDTRVEMLVLHLPQSLTSLGILEDDLELTKESWAAMLTILSKLPILTEVYLNWTYFSEEDMMEGAKDIADTCNCIEHITFSESMRHFRVTTGLDGKKVVRRALR